MISSRRKWKIRLFGGALVLASVASACTTEILVGLPEATPQSTPGSASGSLDPTPAPAPTATPTPAPAGAFAQARATALVILDDAPSIAMETETAMTLDGVVDLGVSMSTLVDRDANLAEYTIEFSGADWATTLAADPTLGLGSTSSSDPDRTTVTYVIDAEQTAYFRFDPQPAATDPARPWTSITVDQRETADSGVGPNLLRDPDATVDGVRNLLSMLSDVSVARSDTVEGNTLDTYRAMVSNADVAALLPPTSQLLTGDLTTDVAVMAGQTQVTIGFSEGELRLVEIDFQGFFEEVNGQDASLELGPITLVGRHTFTLGRDARIVVPSPETVLELRENEDITVLDPPYSVGQCYSAEEIESPNPSPSPAPKATTQRSSWCRALMNPSERRTRASSP